MSTKQENKSARIAKKLATALHELEQFDGDPEMVLEDAKIRLSGMDEPFNHHATKALEALERYYTDE